MPESKIHMSEHQSDEKPRKRGRSKRALRFSRRLGRDTLLMVGNLKCGKSTIFSWISSGKRQTLADPESGIELTIGALQNRRFTRLVDVPGCNSLLDRSEDAQLIRNLLSRRHVGGALLVLESKNLRRGLVLAMQLAEFDLPVVVALNMRDEALHSGIEVDAELLSKKLGVPVVSTVAVEGHGLGQLKRTIGKASPILAKLKYPESLSAGKSALEQTLDGYPLSAGGLSFQLISEVPQASEVLDDHLQQDAVDNVREILSALERSGNRTPDVLIAEAFQEQAGQLTELVQTHKAPRRSDWLEKLAVLTRKPLTGIPIALAVLVLLYLFVGWLGAMVLVDLLEVRLFGELLLPLLQAWLEPLSENMNWLREMLVGQFGLISVGIALPIAIVLPVLATFFFAFGLLEDSGYLPRMSLLVDRILRRMGLNGKGLLPLVMGFSCVTMAVLTTRILDTRKQRIIATALLMLAVPCAPLLGVMMVVLAHMHFGATLLLFGLIGLQFLIVGAVLNAVLPGRKQDFLMELPPLRVPGLRNSLHKTGHRLFWFFREAIPVFLIGSLVLFALDQLGLIDGLREATRPVLEGLMGLPPESADVFLMCMIRREAGAAILLQQSSAGLYDGVQTFVALLVITMLIPCINALLAMYKERGFVVSTIMLVLMSAYALGLGALTSLVLRTLGVEF